MVRGSWEERLADMQARTFARHGRGGGRAMTRAAVAGEPPAAPLPGGAAVSGYDGGEGAERVSVPLSGDTRLFAVVGDPVGQVRSPLALTRRLAARGENAIVAPLHVTPRDLAGALAGLALVANLGGLLVTVPHKAAAFALCAAVSGRARFVGSVNVMRKGGGGWYGDNADGWGYAEGWPRPASRCPDAARSSSAAAGRAPPWRWNFWSAGRPRWRCTTSMPAAATASPAASRRAFPAGCASAAATPRASISSPTSRRWA